ncbi:hypothetical protein YC2023_014773 [Brassica napus]
MNGSDTNVVLPANGFSSGGVNYRNGLWLADVKEIVQDLVDHLGEELLRLIKRFLKPIGLVTLGLISRSVIKVITGPPCDTRTCKSTTYSRSSWWGCSAVDGLDRTLGELVLAFQERHRMQNLSGCNFSLSLIILSSLDILPPNYSFHNADKCLAIYGIWVPIIPPANQSESSALGPTTEYLSGNFQLCDEDLKSVAGPPTHEINHTSYIGASSDIGALKEGYLCNHEEFNRETSCYRFSTQPEHAANWFHTKRSNGLGDMQVTSQTIYTASELVLIKESNSLLKECATQTHVWKPGDHSLHLRTARIRDYPDIKGDPKDSFLSAQTHKIQGEKTTSIHGQILHQLSPTASFSLIISFQDTSVGLCLCVDSHRRRLLVLSKGYFRNPLWRQSTHSSLTTLFWKITKTTTQIRFRNCFLKLSKSKQIIYGRYRDRNRGGLEMVLETISKKTGCHKWVGSKGKYNDRQFIFGTQ